MEAVVDRGRPDLFIVPRPDVPAFPREANLALALNAAPIIEAVAENNGKRVATMGLLGPQSDVFGRKHGEYLTAVGIDAVDVEQVDRQLFDGFIGNIRMSETFCDDLRSTVDSILHEAPMLFNVHAPQAIDTETLDRQLTDAGIHVRGAYLSADGTWTMITGNRMPENAAQVQKTIREVPYGIVYGGEIGVGEIAYDNELIFRCLQELEVIHMPNAENRTNVGGAFGIPETDVSRPTSSGVEEPSIPNPRDYMHFVDPYEGVPVPPSVAESINGAQQAGDATQPLTPVDVSIAAVRAELGQICARPGSVSPVIDPKPQG